VVLELRNRRSKLVESPADAGSSWAAIIGRGIFDQDSVRASYTAEIPLDTHLEGCRKWAAIFARELPERLGRTVFTAAALHDIGKADPRFQAWLRGGNPVKPHELIAKSGRSGQNPRAIERARALARYPKGARHELASVALLAQGQGTFPELDFDLLLHLISSHHGRCRPLSPVVADNDPVQIRYRNWITSSDHRLEKAGSGICERFWRLTKRYGWYGLAYLESLVRLADHRQSELEQDRDFDSVEAAHA
jgi:CRISPR-associated endonuclease/helicase Cas3